MTNASSQQLQSEPQSTHETDNPAPVRRTPIGLNLEPVLSEANILLTSFEQAARGITDDDEFDDDKEGDEEPDDDEELVDFGVTAGTINEALGSSDEMRWVDEFILSARRKGGRDTEKSVLKLWKVSIP